MDSQKIDVIHLGVTLDGRFHDVRRNTSENYILYVGERRRYKNFVTFLRGVAPVLRRKSISLICVGSAPTSEEKCLLLELDVSQFVYFRSLSDPELFECYRNAIMFCFPSLDEGFGIPVLEAFRAGCPVALSDIGVFREVAGQAALFFNPSSEAEIGEAVLDLVGNRHLREKFSREGLKRVQDFSLAKCIGKTYACYRYSYEIAAN